MFTQNNNLKEMPEIYNFIDELISASDERFEKFEIKEITSITDIDRDAYLEKPVWMGGDTKFVCLFIDLDQSSKMSFKRQVQTMAKLYDSFTQNIVDVFKHPRIGADYIDIKGDGAFGIFEGEKAAYKAFYCALTFKELFFKYISPKFSYGDVQLGCKMGIHKDKLLVKKIGKRGARNYNEVWAGRLINNASKLAAETKNIDLKDRNSGTILLSEEVYADFKGHKNYGFYSCCDGKGNTASAGQEIFRREVCKSEDVLGEYFYYTLTTWCRYHSDNFISQI